MNSEKTIIQVEEALRAAVEQADYVYNTKKDVVTTFINNGLDTTSPAFVKYQKEMEDAYGKFQKAKAEIEKKYVLSTFTDVQVNWSLDYSTGELTIVVL